MLKSEMQHQFWVTKKAVQRRLGSKEDACIVSSDSELDSKIELFKSIAESCSHLYRIIDHYQERVCILAQEENALGKFLKEAGKTSNTTGKIMTSAGKAISYCGQQRMTIRPPLLRLHHEVETFRGRAIADTNMTIVAMEKERTEYRAALSWMKSASSQLDPDTGKGVEKFRKAQTHVRLAKAKFDRLSLDCLQKIDLLAAARCSMFSHALVAYMTTLLQFATKSSETFRAAAKALSTNIQYNFTILKELTQTAGTEGREHDDENASAIDSDQMLFFLDEYKDKESSTDPVAEEASLNDMSNQEDGNTPLIDVSSSTEFSEKTNLLDNSTNNKSQKENISDLLDALVGTSSNDFGDFASHLQQSQTFMTPTQLLLDDLTKDLFTINDDGDSLTKPSTSNDQEQLEPEMDDGKTKKSILDFFNLGPSTSGCKAVSSSSTTSLIGTGENKSKEKIARKDMSAWFQLFSELDPLANPDQMAREIEGGKENSETA